MIYFSTLGETGKSPEAVNTGLGNMYFQIAATYAAAKRHGVSCFFPEWKYNEYVNGIPTTNTFNISIIYPAPTFKFVKLPYVYGIDYRGFMQSERYFENCPEDIRHIFTLKPKYHDKLYEKWAPYIKNSMSIHVRRGDYLNKQEYLPFPSDKYYADAAVCIAKKHTIDNVLVFSDDIPYCKQKFNNNFIFVEGQTDWEDLYTMSFCNHNITCNSSFSWWASWLNTHPDKVVTVPKVWFTGLDCSDIFRKDMIIL